jgi:hypothetical protein
MAKEKGSVVRVWFGNKLGVALMDPRDVEVTELFFFSLRKIIQTVLGDFGEQHPSGEELRVRIFRALARRRPPHQQRYSLKECFLRVTTIFQGRGGDPIAR